MSDDAGGWVKNLVTCTYIPHGINLFHLPAKNVKLGYS